MLLVLNAVTDIVKFTVLHFSIIFSLDLFVETVSCACFRRRSGEYQENYTHDGDSCGIHGSGAGFPKMDPADKWVPSEY